MRARLVLAAISLLIACTGCNRRITLGVVAGNEMAQSLPSGQAVHPYPGLPTVPEPAPLVAVYVSGPGNLESLAEFWTHHLYFELISCADRRHSATLFSGPVFRATRAEQGRLFRTGSVKNESLYKVYVPLDPRRLDQGNIPSDLPDVLAYRESARVGGVCLRMRGGNMSGFGLESNVVRAPLAIDAAGSLRVETEVNR